LIFTSLDQVYWAECTFSDQFHDFEAVYKLFGGAFLEFLEVAHRAEVLLNLDEVFKGKLFIDFPE
jgi:hypothetical protein